MRERTRTRASIDEGAIAVFLDGLAGMTPQDMARRAHALAVVVQDAPNRPGLPVSSATLVEALRRVRAANRGALISALTPLTPRHVRGRRHEAQVGLFQPHGPLPLGQGEQRQEPRRLLAHEAVLVGRLPVAANGGAERGEVVAHERGRERVVVDVG